ncbi:hypothetical protein BH11VER1_BH11VER1_20880 [soil metagenome]
MIATLRQLLLKAAWAPISVLVFHAIIAKTDLRHPLDFTVHFSGGAAIAFFLFEALSSFELMLGTLKPLGRYLFSFALACTVGLFWEFAELLSDVFRHTHIQQSLTETMSDLIADSTGAIASLLLVFLIRQFCSTVKRPGTLLPP